MFESFIANHIRFDKTGEKKVSPPTIRIAIAGIALGLTAMILSVAIIVGFKKEISDKIIGFGSHIQISNFDSNSSYETSPIAVNDSLINTIQTLPGIKHLSRFATKPGIIKTDTDAQGIILKGVDQHYDWEFFRNNMEEGTVPEILPDENSTQVIISRHLANKLRLNPGDSFLTYFVENEVRVRKFLIAGIYRTDFSEYDQLFVLADIKQIQRLNRWDEDMVSGIEIRINDFEQLEEMTDVLYNQIGYRQDRLGNVHFIRSVTDLNPMIFSWLDILDMNIVIILLLILTVAGFTMISGLLIIILERVNMIGILKALGANNTSIRMVFMQVSFFLILKGMFWGNIIALSICFLQKQFGILKLDPKNYYISCVPIDINIWNIILINICILVVSILMLIGPSYIIAKISPAKTIQFE